MVNKLVKDVEEEVWRKFAGYCKAKNERVGKKLSQILKDYLKNKIK